MEFMVETVIPILLGFVPMQAALNFYEYKVLKTDKKWYSKILLLPVVIGMGILVAMVLWWLLYIFFNIG